MKTPYKPLPYAPAELNEKILKIQPEHHKEYKPRLRNACIAIYLFVGMIGLGVWGASQDEWWGYALGFVGFGLFGWMPNWIFRLGNEDDRSYFLKCIGVCDDKYDLAEIGFDEQYDHIEKIVFEKLLNDHPSFVGMDEYIRKLHKKHDLRRLADEVEEYESM